MVELGRAGSIPKTRPSGMVRGVRLPPTPYIKVGEQDKALEHLFAATRLDPLYPAAHYQLAALYQRLGREGEARRECEAFEKLEQTRKQIDQVNFLTRSGSSDTDLSSPNHPKN